MLRLKHIKGVQIGRHRLVEKEVTGNVLGLWGVSGTGKSTVLQLLEWLMTGKIEHPDPIAEFIRCVSDEDIKKMEGVAKFEVDGKPLEIHREQSRSGGGKRNLKWDKKDGKWEVEEKSAAGVENLLTSIIGANQKAISSIVFIRQGAFASLVSGLDSERRDFFVRLLMLGHLEKMAGVIDTYRKELMGSVSDLSALRDQADAAYRQAQKYFEEVDFDLGRMRSYKDELADGAEMVRLQDSLVSREADLGVMSTALDAGLATAGLTRASLDAWLDQAGVDLVTMRETLASAQTRRNNRTTYEASQSRLTVEISNIRNWMVLDAKRASLVVQVASAEVDAAKPNPRVRIKQLEDWASASKLVDALQEQFSRIPLEDAAGLKALDDAAEAARLASAKVLNDWKAATDDLADLVKLEQVARTGICEESCRLCGNEHPDATFVVKAAANTRALVARLIQESAPLEETRRITALAAAEARSAAAASNATRNGLEARLVTAKAAAEGSPSPEKVAVEIQELSASLAVYDAAVSLRDHIRGEISALSAQLGATSHTQNELDGKQSELDLAAQMLGMLPSSAEIAAEIAKLTDDGTRLRETSDKLTGMRDNYNRAKVTYNEQLAKCEGKIAELSKTRPFLISSITALGPVITAENRDKVLADLRIKQSEYDAQVGQTEAARRGMVAADQNLQELEMRAAEQANRIVIGKELEAARAAFLPSGITADYLSHQFERIAITTQDHLSQMSADFMVVASEKVALSFDFLMLNEPNGSWHSQNRMSGGQKVKLAIAVLLAIHELIIPQVGMLVLDEPSTHLDDDSKVALAEMLKELGQRGNLQLIVCDHSPILRDAYTDTIELHADRA